jgi:hypothetical protein
MSPQRTRHRSKGPPWAFHADPNLGPVGPRAPGQGPSPDVLNVRQSATCHPGSLQNTPSAPLSDDPATLSAWVLGPPS